MADEGYNGWTNYPTWCVSLWIDNDEGTYTTSREMAANARSEESEGTGRMARGTLADSLRDWVTNDLTPDLGATFAADLLGWALESVDWYEIAEAFLSE